MPMYDFRCTKCEHAFEEIVAITAAPPPCPKCEGATEKLLSELNFLPKRRGPSKKAVEHEAKYRREKEAEQAQAKAENPTTPSVSSK